MSRFIEYKDTVYYGNAADCSTTLKEYTGAQGCEDRGFRLAVALKLAMDGLTAAQLEILLHRIDNLRLSMAQCAKELGKSKQAYSQSVAYILHKIPEASRFFAAK